MIQTSSMDCGPAALTSVLKGFGIPVNYDWVRDECRTAIDGTAIEDLEHVASLAGLDVAQTVLPADHLRFRESAASPSITAIKTPSGAAHFVVWWGNIGRTAQIMDPARGRRWIPWRDLERQLYVHSVPVDPSDWRRWAASNAFLDPLARRLRTLGVRPSSYVNTALRDRGWHALATLDAAVRATGALVSVGTVKRGRLAATMLDHLIQLSIEEALELLPREEWSIWRGALPGAVAAADTLLTGAVLLRVGNRQASPIRVALAYSAGSPDQQEYPHPALTSPAPQGSRPQVLRELYRAAGPRTLGVLTAALGACALVRAFEAVLFRGLLEVWPQLDVVRQRLGAIGALALLAVAVLAIQFPLVVVLRRIGRCLELDLRRRLQHKVPRLADAYLRTRAISDLAERAHRIERIRALPTYLGQAIETLAEALGTVAGICWLHPAGLAGTLALAATMFAIPGLAQGALVERDLRVRSIASSLRVQFLDVLLGLVSVRAHRAQRTVRMEHETRVTEWADATQELQRWTVGIDTVQGVLGTALAFHLLSSCAAPQPGVALLLVYWAARLPSLARQLAYLGAEYPAHRNIIARILEPLAAPEATPPPEISAPPPTNNPAAMRIAFRRVRIEVSGRPIIDIDDLEIPAGVHVAIIGPSGAGKSTIIGALLGWRRPAEGRIEVDGELLTDAMLDIVRARTVWIDPSVHLWNATLAENVTYGADDTADSVAKALEVSDLDEVVARLATGMQTPIGDSGALLSGGEGQRVRFSRALLRSPGLVLLDEAFRGLERTRRNELLARARTRWARTTLICVTHDVQAAGDFDLVVVVEAGRVVEVGAPSQLGCQEGSRYRAMLSEQEIASRHWHEGWRRIIVAEGQIREMNG